LGAREVEQYAAQLNAAVAAISARAGEIGLAAGEAAELTAKLKSRVTDPHFACSDVRFLSSIARDRGS
jgi:hypothetical protein